MSYTFPTVAAIMMAIIIAIFQTISQIEKYKFLRIIPLSILNTIEIIIASFLVRLVYCCAFFESLFLIPLIGLFFNILLVVMNDYIIDIVTKKQFLQD